jgi:hypothetical protein
MKRMRNALRIATIIPLILFIVSCSNRVGNSEKSHTLLVISKLTGTTATGDEADFAQSDVVKVDITTGTNYVVADAASATLTATLTEQESPATGSSFKENIRLTHYTVTFTFVPEGTSGGLTGVPIAFEGSVSSLVEIDSSTDVTFIVVTEAAKLASPLIDLRAGGVIEARAAIKFYGKDMADNDVESNEGYISIFFANYIDQ